MNTLIAVDTVHTYVPNIPAGDASIQQVNGYVTQEGDTAGIEWSQADWDRFPDYIKHTIAQLNSGNPLTADILDVETGAASDAEAVRWALGKLAAQEIAVIYVDAANADDLTQSLAEEGVSVWNTYLWLADWSLSLAEAEAKLGTYINGYEIVMVQWASPSSNPRTYLPGTNYQLQDAGCDLSVAVAFPAWDATAAGTSPSPVPAPAPAPAQNWMETMISQLSTVLPGDTGKDVYTLQGCLIARGYFIGKTGRNSDGIDGDYGPLSEAAVRNLQFAARITVDGKCGPETWPAVLDV
jgi:hypothetical protein